jgi:hypothetical protein
MDDVVRKYRRYTLNEKPFNPDVVVDLIHLRKASMLEDAEFSEILNEISRWIVREKGKTIAAYILKTWESTIVYLENLRLWLLSFAIQVLFHALLFSSWKLVELPLWRRVSSFCLAL